MNTTASLKSFRIGKRSIGPGEPIFLIAEVANCHEGDFDTAKKMVEVIARSGVDAVKFQLHIPAAEMTHDHPKFTTQGKRALSAVEIQKLKTLVESKGLLFLCTPFSREAADELEAMGVDVFKIGSGEMSDPDFIEHVAKKGKPMLVSTGMSSLEEIDRAVDIMQRYKVPFLLFHCVSIYPATYERLNLGVIKLLQERYHAPIGLSDHTSEIFSAIASVPLGVSAIEKHYTLDRNTVGTSDHKVSLEPSEWTMLVDGVRKVERALGTEKRILDEEKPVIEWARHSVVAVCDIRVGTVISREMLTTKRPLYNAIPAHKLLSVIGKRARCDISRDSRINHHDIEP